MEPLWTVWWDFVWTDKEITHYVIQTDHPQYEHVDHIHKFKLSTFETHDDFEDWFAGFKSNIKSGRVSIHTLMKSLGYKKKEGVRA